MTESRTVTLSETNWKQLDMLLARIPSSDFIKFCLMNEIVEEGIKRCEEKYLQLSTTL